MAEPYDISEELRAAIRDYRLLLDRGYPVRATVQLVGDRYRLERTGRIVLFRGVLDAALSASIRSRTVAGVPEKASLAVDGYNVLFTIANYLKGHPLFVGTDGLLRDAGGAHGRFGAEEAFIAAAGMMVDRLAALDPGRVVVYLDAPVSGSGRHAAVLREFFSRSRVPAEVEVVPSADSFVRDHGGDAAATADSAIAASSCCPVYDLARDILELRFGATFPDLAAML